MITNKKYVEALADLDNRIEDAIKQYHWDGALYFPTKVMLDSILKILGID